MWGTSILDVYRREEVTDVRDALEALLGPECGGDGWCSGGRW